MARASHHSNDWCHICGERREHLVDLQYPENAEHNVRPYAEYIRICDGCIDVMREVVSGDDPRRMREWGSSTAPALTTPEPTSS